MSALPEGNPIYGPFFGVMGAASAIIFSGGLSKINKIIILLQISDFYLQENTVTKYCIFS